MRNIVFWDPSYSPHKISFVDAVAKALPGCNIFAFADADISAERRSLGWKSENPPKVQWNIKPNEHLIKERVFCEPKETLHVLSGIRWVETITSAIKHIKQSGACFAIMQEPRVREGWRGELRFLQSWATENWYRRNLEFVLAIGRNGPPWFESVGYHPDKIIPFAYYVDPPNSSTAVAASLRSNNKVTIGYAGRLVTAKGIMDVAQAASELGREYRLLIAGSGPDADLMRNFCLKHKIDVSFLGVLPIDEIGNFMSRLDVLVLASNTKDGWGVVVSEALMSGTAVVTTPCVGASILMKNPIFGRCVPANDPSSIAQAIRILATSNEFHISNRLQRKDAAIKMLSAESGADYFAKIIQWRFEGSSKPRPFWESQNIAPNRSRDTISGLTQIM